MRPDQELHRVEPRVLAQLRDPEVAHVLGLRHRAGEERAADEEEIRLLGAQPDPRAELPAGSRLALEPLVERGRAGDRDPFRGDSVQAHRLALLDLVPDDEPVRGLAKQLLAREVVPARDAHAGGDPRCRAARTYSE